MKTLSPATRQSPVLSWYRLWSLLSPHFSPLATGTKLLFSILCRLYFSQPHQYPDPSTLFTFGTRSCIL